MYEFCKKTGHNLEYPYVDENEDHLKDPVQLKDINLKDLINEIEDYIMDIKQEKEPREIQVPPTPNSRILPPPPPKSILLQKNYEFRQPLALQKNPFDLVHSAAGQRRQNNKFRTKRHQNKKFRTQRRQKPLVRRINSRRRQPNYKFKTQRRQKPRKTQVRHKIKNKKP
jgi:hypothetical protein